MNKVKLALSTLLLLLGFSVFTSSAQTQAPTTFVSSQGKDSNTCDVSDKPCRNISAAINKVQAGGSVVILDSGTYQSFVVNKAVSVVTAPGAHAVINVSSGHGVHVSASSTDIVVLRGLTLNGLGGLNGIQYNAGAALSVENCVVQGFSGNGIRVDGDGQQLFVKDTTVRNTQISGIFVGTTFGPVKASIDRSRLESNKEGLFVTDNGKVSIRDSVVSGSKFQGVLAFTFNAGATSEINVENCLITGCENAGIQADGNAGTALIRVSSTTVTSNSSGINAVSPVGTILSRGNNTVEGNLSDGSFTALFTAK